MFYKILDTELEYANLFSQVHDEEDYVRFTDNKLLEMHMHNFLLVKKYESEKQFIEIINNEIEMRRKTGAKFCRIEYYFPVDENIISQLDSNADKTTYDYYFTHPKSHKNLIFNDKCKVYKAEKKKILKDGMYVDVLANTKAMGKKFAKQRIKRKSKVYKKEDSNLDLYVCYSDEIVVGNCEMLFKDGIVKLEDFDILPEYQQMGYGTSMLKHLLKTIEDSEGTYLVTDNNSSAKDMYLKCGFEKIGEKTELLFRFN